LKRKSFIIMTVLLLFWSLSLVSAQTVQYKYDALNRLVEADLVTNGRTSYVYDAAGNLLKVKKSSDHTFLTFMEELSSTGISEGWKPYATEGVSVEYRLLSEEIEQLNGEQKNEVEKESEMEESKLDNEIEIGDDSGLDGNAELKDEIKIEDKSEVMSDLKVHNLLEKDEEQKSNEEFETDNQDASDKKHITNEEIEAVEQIEGIEETNPIPHLETDKKVERLFNEVQQISTVSVQPGGANVYRDFRVEGQQTYTIKGWVKAEELHQAVVQVIINYYDKNDMLISHKNIINIFEPSDWIQIESTVTPPIDAINSRIHLQILSPSSFGSGIAKFSGISLGKDSMNEK